MRSWWEDPNLEGAVTNFSGATRVAVHQWIRKQVEDAPLSLAALSRLESRWTQSTIQVVLADLLRNRYLFEVENPSKRRGAPPKAYATRQWLEARGKPLP